MKITLPNDHIIELSSIACEILEELKITVAISHVDNIVYIHSKHSDEVLKQIENIVLGKSVGVLQSPKKPKQKLTKQ